ncbi:RluA family pseudouridine synthase [Coraliomargarita akajimensis]|uniref:Pseudouridine synthase n=1 Tax=Coraliomargarita akajimensis (strain DSM 45221 / IAM 15411 / JCM 23193 / KCTC 12865 / 04OKA010-24) TaxID=583355 RepID=D5EK60_CORAD|nr:RluA family pseudouridine synthase [Coraliomargarita akajimensis]ADE54809.1 pseudouridine synthase, RluA family [Coraliomargarita akajimensis DSM 45221]
MARRVIEFRVPDGIQSGRADKLFASKFEDISRARLQRAFDAGQVSFDGEAIDKRFKINRGGLLRAVLDEPDANVGPRPVDMPLEIVYEDSCMVVVSKPVGMVTHPGSGTGEDTLVHALLHHTGGQLSSVGAPERPGIVHRLDKETSGLIAVAKTDLAHHKLASAFSERNTYKRYRALVLGSPMRSSGTVREPIGRHPVVRTRMAVQPNGRDAHTDWTVDERFGDRAALISCVIHTGRTHQIRVHMSHERLPLLGDTTYGFKPNRLKGISVPRVMLHSTELHLPHPETGKLLELNAPLPQDFERVIEALRLAQ